MAKPIFKLSENRIRSGIAISGTLRRDSSGGFLLRRKSLLMADTVEEVENLISTEKSREVRLLDPFAVPRWLLADADEVIEQDESGHSILETSFTNKKAPDDAGALN